MEHKCLNCGTEMNVYNQIKLDMIDNPYVGKILFECPNCRHYRRSVFPIASIFEARDAIDAGESILGCNNFDDLLKKLEEIAWNSLVKLDDLEHGCKTCKYGLKWLTEEPCSSCDIRLGNNKWEPDEEEDGDKS